LDLCFSSGRSLRESQFFNKSKKQKQSIENSESFSLVKAVKRDYFEPFLAKMILSVREMEQNFKWFDF